MRINLKAKFRRKSKAALGLLLAASMVFSLFTGNLAFAANTKDTTIPIVSTPQDVAKQIEDEGIVLLKNDDNVLPLTSNAKVNVFGTGSISPFYGGGGSGNINADEIFGFYDALESADIQFNKDLMAVYATWYEANKNEEREPGEGGSTGQFGAPTSRIEMPVDELTDEIMEQALDYSNTAILFIGRGGTEGGDLEASVLKLIPREADLVEKVATAFDNVIVIFNISNTLEMGFLDEYDSIKAAAIIGAPGEFGMESVGKVLSGEVNPSGRLADTIAYNLSDHPSTENFGHYEYTDNPSSYIKYFVDYEEGIYIGYRYFETFDVPVQYPFGHGLSYTDFEWVIKEFEIDEEQVKVDVEVTNIGEMAGKDVVEVYFTAPYTENGIEKPSIELAGYAKTHILEVGESETVTITYNTNDMSSYDMVSGAWVLEEGVYEIKIAASAHNIIFTEEYHADSDIIIKNDEVTGNEIGNLFEDAQGNLTYLSRADKDGTYPEAPAAEDFIAPDGIELADNWPVPETVGEAPTIGAEYAVDIKLSDVYRDEALWDEFLDQLTLDEMIDLVVDGGYQTHDIKRLGIPKTYDNDGPASIKGHGGFNYEKAGIAWPSETVVACTWNDELAEEMGVCVGIEAKELEINVWYAPATNTHRNPMAGRNFEYYSEDPLLAGKMAAAVTRGAGSQNLIVTVKHFALNDQEKNRDQGGLCTWANEQSMREIYLKSFEIAVKEGGALGIMSSFNRLGTTWAGGSKALLTDLLREEWGFKGFVVTDFYVNFGSDAVSYMSSVLAVYAQNDTLLTGVGSMAYPALPGILRDAYHADPIGFGRALRTCAKNLCNMKMQTNVFGSYSLIVEGFDWGPAITKAIINVNKTITSADKDDFTAHVKRSSGLSGDRTITKTYVSDAKGNPVESSTYITIEMKVHPAETIGSPFNFSMATFLNDWVISDYTITQLSTGYQWIKNSGQSNLIADDFTKDTVTYKDITFGYAAYAPTNDSHKNPLVIWLHGAGEGGTDPNVVLLGNKVVNLATPAIQDIFNSAYILTPQAPTMWMDDGTGHYTLDGTSMYTEALMNLIKTYAAGNPDIDVNRIYIGGCSNGGFMTMNMLFAYPEYFAAAYPVCEAYQDSWITDEQINSIKDIPIWFTQAANDKTVIPNTAVLLTYDRLLKAGAKNTHLTYWENVVDTTGLYKKEDGTPYSYDGHWSWLYTLNNECKLDYDESPVTVGGKEVTIMEWLASNVKKEAVKNPNGGTTKGHSSAGTSRQVSVSSYPSSVGDPSGWKKDSSGWRLETSQNKYAANEWKLVNNLWYFFNGNGYMVTGWVLLNNQWYYLNESGAMVTGWLLYNNQWYFLNSNGSMATGWILTNGIWYYLNASGDMTTSPVLYQGKEYQFNQSGACINP